MKCVFLSTVDEDVECFKDCGLYNWAENNNKCPFQELAGGKTRDKQTYNYDDYKDDSSMPLSMLYKERDYI